MAKTPIDPNHLPFCLDADDISTLLRISRSKAYQLMNSDGFPVIYIDKRMVTPTKHFLQWMDDHIEK